MTMFQISLGVLFSMAMTALSIRLMMCSLSCTLEQEKVNLKAVAYSIVTVVCVATTGIFFSTMAELGSKLL